MKNQFSVLVVDDTPENIDVIKVVLSDDYTVKAAVNGMMALKIVESQTVDIILLDIMMPEMDGFEVCRRLKENPKTRGIPVIFVTTRDAEMDEAAGFELGAVDYITKPISPTILKARISTHLALLNQNRFLEHKVKQRTRELNETRFEVIRRLGLAAEYRDNETGKHVIRVAKYCKALALAYGLDDDYSELVSQASPMHDVGKIGIPDAILLKPGRLTPEEFEVIKTHCKMGYDILDGSKYELLKVAQIISFCHHEKWDGSGYPNGHKGAEIPIEARIVAICDVFDALSCERPYKKPWPIETIISHFQEQSGKHFDPELVVLFNKILPDFLRISEEYKD